jgi:hypothetical protein
VPMNVDFEFASISANLYSVWLSKWVTNLKLRMQSSCLQKSI